MNFNVFFTKLEGHILSAFDLQLFCSSQFVQEKSIAFLQPLCYNNQADVKSAKKCWCGPMAEQLICNQQVVGSTPITSSIYGRVPERPKGADCKSVVTDFGGPNPPSPTIWSTTGIWYILFVKLPNNR